MAVVLVLVQLVPVQRSNPPAAGELVAPDEVMQVLRRSCYDCHSSETRWPWYARVAPVSWLVARDVKLGRENINFSDWQSYSAYDQGWTAREALEEVHEGKMPLRPYLWMHPEARLSEVDISALERWAASFGGKRKEEDGHDRD